MAYFLAEPRRIMLIHELMGLTMPRDLAESLANFKDDVEYIDQHLAFNITGLGMRCRSLGFATKRGDSKRVKELQLQIQADCSIVRQYVAEIAEREIPKKRFPKISHAMANSVLVTNRVKQLLLTEMAKGGLLG